MMVALSPVVLTWTSVLIEKVLSDIMYHVCRSMLVTWHRWILSMSTSDIASVTQPVCTRVMP
jgi:hypothetical protein